MYANDNKFKQTMAKLKIQYIIDKRLIFIVF